MVQNVGWFIEQGVLLLLFSVSTHELHHGHLFIVEGELVWGVVVREGRFSAQGGRDPSPLVFPKVCHVVVFQHHDAGFIRFDEMVKFIVDILEEGDAVAGSEEGGQLRLPQALFQRENRKFENLLVETIRLEVTVQVVSRRVHDGRFGSGQPFGDKVIVVGKDDDAEADHEGFFLLPSNPHLRPNI